MKLLICLITHNRLEYTLRTLDSLRNTITVPHYIIAVDNKSTDDTREWLKQAKKDGYIDYHILNQGNYYPGKATNMGWGMGLYKYPKATHLMRLDNDMVFKPGWDKKAKEYFKKFEGLGQLGLDHSAVETDEAKGYGITSNGMTINEWPGVIGGPCIIPREIWDSGLRYDETPWHAGPNGQVVMQEDSLLSHQIKNKGYTIGHMTERLSYTFADENNWFEYPEYYKKTMSERGYKENLKKI